MDALLVVFTDPGDVAHEDEYNRWYTDEHLPDVLAVPGYVRAARYRVLGEPGAITQRYLALYELDVADEAGLQAVSDEHMRRIAADEMRRSAPGVMRRETMRALYYTAAGPRVGGDAYPPDAVWLVFGEPSAPERAAEFDAWYQHHLAEVLAGPGFVAARRYRATGINMLDRPWVASQPHLAVYDLAGSPADVQAAMAELRRRIADGDGISLSDVVAPIVSAIYTRVDAA